MKELVNFIENNKSMTITSLDEREVTVKWELENVGFCLYINKDVVDKYVFHGKLYLKRFTGETDETSVWNTLDSEKEMINLLEEMISSSLDLKNFMRDKHDILNWGISE